METSNHEVVFGLLEILIALGEEAGCVKFRDSISVYIHLKTSGEFYQDCLEYHVYLILYLECAFNIKYY